MEGTLCAPPAQKLKKSPGRIGLTERKSSKQYSVVLWVEGEKFKFAFKDFIFVVSSAANSGGTMPEFAAFGSAKYSSDR